MPRDTRDKLDLLADALSTPGQGSGTDTLPSDIAAELELLRDLKARVVGFGGDDYTIMSWEAAHSIHESEGEPYIGCCFCRDQFVERSELDRVRAEERAATRAKASQPTHICLDCGALGYAGGYHDHGGGEAGDTCSIEELRTSYIGIVQRLEAEAEDRVAEARAEERAATLRIRKDERAKVLAEMEPRSRALLEIASGHPDPQEHARRALNAMPGVEHE